MPKPEEAAYIPTFDETKLGRTQFRRLMDLYAEAKSRANEAEEAASEYKSQMSALMLKNKVEACRVEGYVARWCKGSVRRTLVPELLLSAGVKTSQLEKGYKVTESADYFAVFAPKSKPESE